MVKRTRKVVASEGSGRWSLCNFGILLVLFFRTLKVFELQFFDGLVDGGLENVHVFEPISAQVGLQL